MKIKEEKQHKKDKNYKNDSISSLKTPELETKQRILGIDPGLNHTGWAIIEKIVSGFAHPQLLQPFNAQPHIAATSGSLTTYSAENNHSTYNSRSRPLSLRSLGGKQSNLNNAVAATELQKSNLVTRRTYTQASAAGKQYRYIASGVIRSKSSLKDDQNEENAKGILFYKKLLTIFTQISEIIHIYSPNHCAIEDTYVNSNFASSLKLAHARTAAILAALANSNSKTTLIPVAYPAKTIKKTLTSSGNADKNAILRVLDLFLADFAGGTSNLYDESDALAIALCHGYHL